jgi:hypothetical protein
MADKTLEVILKTLYQGQGAKDAKADIDQLGGAAAYLKGAFLDMGKALLAGFGTAAVVQGIKSAVVETVRLGDELYNTSQKIGIGVEELSRLQYVAKISNLSVEGLTIGVKFLSRNMEAAKVEGSEMSKVMARLGVDLGGSASDAMMKLADVFAGMPDGVQKTALAVQLFGRSGIDMIPMLNQGSAAIREMQAESDKIGVTWSEVDAKAADELADRVDNLKESFKGGSESIVKDMLPALNLWAAGLQGWRDDLLSAQDTLVGFIRAMKDGFTPEARNVANKVIPYLAAAMDRFLSSFQGTQVIWELTKRGMQKVREEAQQMGPPITLMTDKLKAGATAGTVLAASTSDMVKNMAPLSAVIYDVDGSVKDLTVSTEGFNDAAYDFMNQGEGMADTTADIASGVRTDKEASESLLQAFERLGGTTEVLVDEMEQLPTIAEKVAWAMQDLAMSAGADFFQGLMDGSADFEESFQKFTDGIREIWSNMMVDMLKQWKDSMKEGSKTENPFATAEGKAQFAMGALSIVGGMATANNQKGQQVMAVGSAIAAFVAQFNAIIGAVIMAITVIVASLQDNGKRSIAVVMNAAGELSVQSDQFDDVLRDMNKQVQDVYRKYFIGFRDLLVQMGVDVGDFRATIEEGLRNLLNGGGKTTGEPGAEEWSGNLSGTGVDYNIFFKDAVGDAMKRFDDWIQNGFGRQIFSTLTDMFSEGLNNIGVDKQWANQLLTYWSNALNADDLFASISQFIKNVLGLKEQLGNLQLSGADLMGGVRADMGMSFADQLAQYDEGISGLADTIRNAFDFEDMNAQGAELLTKLEERYQMEIQYLQKLAQLQDQLNKSADEQMRSLSRLGMSGQQIIGLDMQEYQSLMQQLMGATTADQASAIFQQIQALINEIVGAAGDQAPAMKDQLMAMLAAAQEAMNARFTALADEVAAQNQTLYGQIGDVLGYFTGEAYNGADGLSEVATAAFGAATALWGVAGGAPQTFEPDFSNGGAIAGSASPGRSAAPIVVTIPPPQVMVINQMDMCMQKLLQITTKAALTAIKDNPRGLGSPMRAQ